MVGVYDCILKTVDPKVFGCLCFILILRPISVDNNINYRFFFPLKCVKEESLARLSIPFRTTAQGLWECGWDRP